MIEEYSTDLEKQAELSLLQTPHLSQFSCAKCSCYYQCVSLPLPFLLCRPKKIWKTQTEQDTFVKHFCSQFSEQNSWQDQIDSIKIFTIIQETLKQSFSFSKTFWRKKNKKDKRPENLKSFFKVIFPQQPVNKSGLVGAIEQKPVFQSKLGSLILSNRLLHLQNCHTTT